MGVSQLSFSFFLFPFSGNAVRLMPRPTSQLSHSLLTTFTLFQRASLFQFPSHDFYRPCIILKNLRTTLTRGVQPK